MSDTTCTKGECIIARKKNEPCSSAPVQKKLYEYLLTISDNNLNLKPNDTSKAIDILKKKKGVANEVKLLKDPEFIKTLSHDDKILVMKDINTKFKQQGTVHTKTPLSDRQVFGVLKRWRREFPRFAISEYAMSDFDKFPHIYNFANKSLVDCQKHGFSRFACVLNTDKTMNGGKHWVAVFAEIKEKSDCSHYCRIEYFDSLGHSPLESVVKWASRNINEMKQHNIKADFYYGNIKHQRKNVECGVYCLYFIRKMLEGENIKFFRCGDLIPDDKMSEFREYIFAEY